MTDNGAVYDRLVELVDLFPTLVDVAGFPAGTLPSCQHGQQAGACHQGMSLMDLIKNPHRDYGDKIEAAFSSTGRLDGKEIGCSIITQGYRYTWWLEIKNDAPNIDKTVAEELYDHNTDPEETSNVVFQLGYQAVRQLLKNELLERLINGNKT